jgi:outer membrane receptor protein involved in Fe transport
MEHVDTISISQVTTVVIPAYFTLNARVAWNPVASVELALCGQNLVNSHHLEVVSDNIITAPRQTDRNIFATVRYTF